MIRKMINRILPITIKKIVKNFLILNYNFGQYYTINSLNCVDSSGEPIPWYTYPAIEYLKQLDFSDKKIFEYGSGNSTLFWAGRCKKVTSVEDNKEWFDRIKMKLPTTVDYFLFQHKKDYIDSINRFSQHFDIIIIDGSYRYECAVEAIKKLSHYGFIILDNSDWKDKTSKILRESDLIEVDMSGFGPINGYTWTTSFYFRRNVKLSSAHQRQPIHGIGSLEHTEA